MTGMFYRAKEFNKPILIKCHEKKKPNRSHLYHPGSGYISQVECVFLEMIHIISNIHKVLDFDL